jgi:hypothetical protein
MDFEFIVSDSAPSDFVVNMVEITVKKTSQKVELFNYKVSVQYYETNRFLSKIHQYEINGLPFTDLFKTTQGESLWQFMYTFSWPEYYRILKINEGLSAIFLVETPDSITFRLNSGLSNYYVYQLLKHHAQRMGVPLKIKSGYFFILLNKINNSGIIILLKHIVRKLYLEIKRLKTKSSKIDNQFDALYFTYGKRYFTSDEKNKSIKDSKFSNIIKTISFKRPLKTLIIDLDNSIQKTIVACEGYSVAPYNGIVGHLRVNNLLSFINLLIQNIKLYFFFIEDISTPKYSNDFFLFSVFPALVRRLFFDYSFIAADEIRKVESLLNTVNPDFIGMTYETGTVQRAAILKAKAFGIRTYGFQHGMIFDNHYDYCQPGVAVSEYKSWHFVTPDILFVWGDYWKSILTNNFSYPESKVNVSGYPKFIELQEEDLLAENNTVILFSNCFMTTTFITDVVSILKKCSKHNFFVKLHPSENNSETKRKICDCFDHEIRFIDNLNTAFETAGLIICQYSTIISEAILYNKNIVLCDFYNLGYPDVYEKFGVLAKANYLEELEHAISRPRPFMTKSARESFIRSFFGSYTDSVERITNKILSDLYKKN